MYFKNLTKQIVFFMSWLSQFQTPIPFKLYGPISGFFLGLTLKHIIKDLVALYRA